MTKLEAIKILLDDKEDCAELHKQIDEIREQVAELRKMVNWVLMAIIVCQKDISETTGFSFDEIRERILNTDREFLASIWPKINFVTFKEMKGLKPRARPKRRRPIKLQGK